MAGWTFSATSSSSYRPRRSAHASAGLYKAIGYISSRTWDPQYEITYWTLFTGSTKEAISAADEQARIRSQGQAEQLRLRMASDLIALQQQIAGGGDTAAVQRRLDSLLGTMIHDRTETDDTPAAVATALSAGLVVSRVRAPAADDDGAVG